MSDILQDGIAVFDPFSNLTVNDVMGGPHVNKQNLVIAIEAGTTDPMLMRLALSTLKEFISIAGVGPSTSRYGRARLQDWLGAEPRRDDESPMECLVRLSGGQSPMIALFAQIDLTHPLDKPDDEALIFVSEMLCTAFEDDKLTLAEVTSLTKEQCVDSIFDALETSGRLLHEEDLFNKVEVGLERLAALIDAYEAVEREQRALAGTMG